jgi:hypothetical protein
MADASFLIVEDGFVVIRSAPAERRGVILCHAGAGALLPAPMPGETFDALVDARVTLLGGARRAEDVVGALREPVQPLEQIAVLLVRVEGRVQVFE